MFKTIATVLLTGALAAAAVPFAAAQQGPPPPPPRWDRSWNDRPLPPRGACFYTDGGFRGNRFCMNAGERFPTLPSGFGDKISSIQVYGGAVASIYNGRDFGGGGRQVGRDVVDLHNLPFTPGHTWNDRISSIAVR